MDGNGWKPDYGISQEGIEVLGFIEALPQDSRRELVSTIARLCKCEGYFSLQDGLGALAERLDPEPQETAANGAKVIPISQGRKR
jgi:hypothetical protein